MKKAYLAIIYIITIVCIIVGIIIHTSRWSGFNFIRPTNMKMQEYDADLVDVNGDNLVVNIDCRIGDVKIIRGDKYHLRYSAINDINTEVVASGNNISVIQKTKITKFGNNSGSNIELTIPSGVDIKTLTVHNDLGDIRVKDISFSEGTISENLGDIRIENCTFTDIDVDNDLGDIKVISCGDLSKYSIDAEVSLGEIKYFDDKYSDRLKRDGNQGTITIDNSLGDITIK